jgi:hypothetical protein
MQLFITIVPAITSPFFLFTVLQQLQAQKVPRIPPYAVYDSARTVSPRLNDNAASIASQ